MEMGWRGWGSRPQRCGGGCHFASLSPTPCDPGPSAQIITNLLTSLTCKKVQAIPSTYASMVSSLPWCVDRGGSPYRRAPPTKEHFIFPPARTHAINKRVEGEVCCKPAKSTSDTVLRIIACCFQESVGRSPRSMPTLRVSSAGREI